jgi:26S proteasome regulatory subunit N10
MEATVICVDNSEWSRNGDYTPNRWESQQEAVNELASRKMSQSPENYVGILSMAGSRAEVIVSPTNDMAKILQAMYDIKVQGQVDLYSSLQIAHLALKHSSKKEQAKRIIMFVCSPVNHDENKYQTIGRNLKRNNISLDIVVFGNFDDAEKLHDLQRAVNSGDNSHFVTIPSGLGFFCDALRSTPIFLGANSGGFDDVGGVEVADPELAAAIRLSLEEQKRKQESEVSQGTEAVHNAEPVEDDEEALLQQAIKMSMEENASNSSNPPNPPNAPIPEASDPTPLVPNDSQFENPEFLDDLMKSVGVDLNDPEVQKVIHKVKEDKKEEEKKE